MAYRARRKTRERTMYLKTPIIWRSLNTIQLHVEVGINLLQVRLHTTLMIIQMQHMTQMAMKILDLRPPLSSFCGPGPLSSCDGLLVLDSIIITKFLSPSVPLLFHIQAKISFAPRYTYA